ncbi:MAG: hypothetical protein RIB84_12590 [Sneathiellaceae bacterium]
MAKQVYYVCDPRLSPHSIRCLLPQRRYEALRGDPPRCAVHGANLHHAPQFDGVPEAEAKAAHQAAERAAGRL